MSEANQLERVVKRFRCGWCGSPTHKDGSPMAMSEIGLTKNIEEYWSDAKLVNGECCSADIQAQEQHEYELRMEQERNA